KGYDEKRTAFGPTDQADGENSSGIELTARSAGLSVFSSQLIGERYREFRMADQGALEPEAGTEERRREIVKGGTRCVLVTCNLLIYQMSNSKIIPPQPTRHLARL